MGEVDTITISNSILLATVIVLVTVILCTFLATFLSLKLFQN